MISIAEQIVKFLDLLQEAAIGCWSQLKFECVCGQLALAQVVNSWRLKKLGNQLVVRQQSPKEENKIKIK